MKRSFISTVAALVACLFAWGCDETVDAPDRLSVKGLDIASVSVAQGVEISVLEGGAPVAQPIAPIVAGKDALVRVHVTPTEGWEPRAVAARLELTSGAETEIFETERSITKESTAGDLMTTLNLYVPGDAIRPDTEIGVTLYEGESDVDPAGRGGSVGANRCPAEGTATLGAQSVGEEPLRIVIVPIRYNADGSGRLPNTSPDRLAEIEAAFYDGYPITGAELRVAEPLDYDKAVGGVNQVAWARLLQRVGKWREDNGVDDQEYVYGLFVPTESLLEYCKLGCVAGLSVIAMRPEDAWARVSIGLGFDGSSTINTMVHEIGHAHGREHSPCGLGGQPSDKNYPHPKATLGTWGYSLNLDAMIDPDKGRDFMSYCEPIWVSDYTYSGLFERVRAVNALDDAYRRSAEPRRWVAVDVIPGHGAQIGRTVTLRSAPGGVPAVLELFDKPAGASSEATGYYYPYSHFEGGVVLVPFPATIVRRIHLPRGNEVVLLPSQPVE